ncbi:sensor histidine kinase [Flavobacterium sp. ENC]|uniref:tetratricopeptide repeat-containing sensor histidine kinase n=1 Tax=Flavobacterium sp. ENC TaxID=2897330 RepID=UPI001E405C56|nr:sensor histidine kinase [Flavobacterium sp. ENC]MCD0467276.1 sensor histidine kinase [Flavobacterium sp. ENC]
MIPYKKGALLLMTILIIGSFLACNEKKESNTLYKKPAVEKIDKTFDWIKVDTNFVNPKYQTTLYTYYNQKIKEKNYLTAAKTLQAAAWNTASYGSYDQRLFQTITAFLEKYKNEIPEQNTWFVNMYYGDYYTDKGDFKKAIEWYTKNTTIETVDYTSCFLKADGYRTIAWCYHLSGNLNLALESEFKALEYFRKMDIASGEGSVYVGIAQIYQASKDYDKAEEFFNKSIRYYAKHREKNLANIFISLYGKINLYDRSMNYTKMKPLIDSVYLAFKKSKINDPSIKVSINIYYSHKLTDENKVEAAKIILDELKPDVAFLNSTVTNQEYRVALAELESKQNKGIRNTKMIHQAIKDLKANQNFTRVRDLYAVLYNDAMNKKDYEKSMLYQDSMYEATDSLGSKEMANIVAQLDKKYQTRAKEQQIALQKKTIVNNNTTIALLVSGLIGFILLTFALTLIRKQRILKQEKQNSQLYTKQLLEKTEEERKRIASDLHDSVSHELLSLKNSFEQKSETTDKKIDTIINDIRIISRNLHPVMFDKIGLKASIEQLTERAQSVNNFMVTSEIEYQNSLPAADELQVYRIIQETLSNIIKHANAVAAKITVRENDNQLLIEIKDNGTGFNVGEKLAGSTAFGLHNIIARSRAINGEAKIVSDKNGTIVTVEIKKTK